MSCSVNSQYERKRGESVGAVAKGSGFTPIIKNDIVIGWWCPACTAIARRLSVQTKRNDDVL